MFIASRTCQFVGDNLLFSILLLSTAVIVFLGGYALFSQARTVDRQLPLPKNWRPWFILGCYGALLTVSLVIIGRRARVLALKLKRIPQKEENVPPRMYHFIQEEYWRTATIAYVSQPKGTGQKGWGTPGGSYDGIRFRRLVLDTVPLIDAQARLIAPHLPILRPQVRIAQHLRALSALFPAEASASSCLLRYDSAVQMARFSNQELTEAEFEDAMRAYQEIMSIFSEYREDRLENT